MGTRMEDFGDVADYVQDDPAGEEEKDSDDEVERRIAEEHVKYKEAQAKRQEEVRANRPWSTQPIDSPRPEQQKEREKERQARASSASEDPPAVPRAEYEPPPRAYLGSQASGSNLSYMSRPQSAENARLGQRVSGSGSRHLEGIKEESPENPSTTSRPASSSGRWGAQDAAGRDQNGPFGTIKEDDREGEQAEKQPEPEPPAAREPSWLSGAKKEEKPSTSLWDEPAPKPSTSMWDEPAPKPSTSMWDEPAPKPSTSLWDEPAPKPSTSLWDEPAPKPSTSMWDEPAPKPSTSMWDNVEAKPEPEPEPQPEPEPEPQAEPEPEPEPEQEQEQPAEPEPEPEQEPEEAPPESPSIPYGTPEPTTPEMAMRGFVEPIGFDPSKSNLAEEAPEEEAPTPESPKEEAAEEKEEEEGYEDEGFEEDAEEEDEDEHKEEDLPPPIPSAEPSAIARTPSAPPSAEPSYAASARRSAASARHTPKSARTPLPGGDSDQEDDELAFRRAAASSAAGSLRGSAAPSPAPAGGPELLPPQQFAMQLLKHDIEVLPSHHKAAAEAAAKKKRPVSGRAAGAGLAAFGYLGYHVPPESLTAAPTGPGFTRPISPGRTGSPGRGTGDGATSPHSGGPGAAGAGSGGEGGDGRPSSAPHARAAAPPPTRPEDALTADMPQPQPTASFIDLARDMRADLVAAATAPASPGGVPEDDASDAAPLTEASLSVLDDADAQAAQNRMKFDTWLDMQKRSSQAHREGGAGGGGRRASAGGDGPRPKRPVTAPLRRPVSARHAAGAYGVPPPQQQQQSAVPRHGGRPMSAQPHHMRPPSASRGGNATGGPVAPGVGTRYDPAMAFAAGGGAEPGVSERVVALGLEPPGAAGTAAVEVAGHAVSVYVADTLKRIVEANRWLLQLGVTSRRYRLKDRLSNMTVQLVEEVPPDESEDPYGEQYDAYDGGYGGGVARMAVVKELTLKQFLSGHAKLKQQAKALRASGAPPPPPQGGDAYGDHSGYNSAGGYGSRRPFSASPAVGGGGGSRSRPTSATYGAGPSQAPVMPGGGYGSGSGARGMRPASANPSYGRTSYGGNGAGGGGYTSIAAYGGGGRPTSASAHPMPRPAWQGSGSASGGYGGAAGGRPGSYGAGGNGPNGLPYMVRSVSARGRSGHQAAYDEDPDDQSQFVIEADDRADITRAVKQQLANAAEFCKAGRQEVTRLRTMPYMPY
ncbi:hypothetical protein HYH03_011511 [Edaphochlamys debaryana]|uniref:Uncharacterized protein n=1 Tax=Edaphochlamys debaryana TaxID=47281 RepID=A0A836BUX9_9CHLO|nr:hypothetical protein HYH03_011511 [Edaphochlamys debaryana]|eukprot:KAG2490046.1 hypothetical protein HYH03_011511 [Edaphochlamys debaryana]